MFKQWLSVSVKLGLLFIVAIVLAACGASGGDDNNIVIPANSNNSGTTVTTNSSFKVYVGGNTATNDDVLSFQQNFWGRLALENRCGECHVPNGQGSVFPFARDDNINTAYNTVVSATPDDSSYTQYIANDSSRSFVVEKVRGGHGCWVDSNSSCADSADLIVDYIDAWKASTAPTSFIAALSQDAPNKIDIVNGRRFASTVPSEFGNLHGTLQAYCADCHTPQSSRKQQPFFAVADSALAYEAIQTKIDLNETENSRLFVRLDAESHNCWNLGESPNLETDRNTDGSIDCKDNALNILEDINTLVSSFQPQSLSDHLKPVASKGLTLSDGFTLVTGSRVEDNAIGLWTFKENNGSVTRNLARVGSENGHLDTSTDGDGYINLDLELNGDIEWWSAGGVTINAGRLQAVNTEEVKNVIFDSLQQTQEYSIETWITPLNVSQGEDEPATIVSYSNSVDVRNFMLSQNLYNYDFYNRGTAAGADNLNGLEKLATPMNQEVAQATLQHVVVTYSSVAEGGGRKIYVDGEKIDVEDPTAATLFSAWSPAYTLVVGNEVFSSDDSRQWQGSMRLLAIHKKALTDDQIKTNFDIGVGEKFILMFDIEEISGVDGTYVAFEVTEFDNYGYLFANPIFYIDDENRPFSNLVLKGIRIGINTREAESGQAFINVDATISNSDLTTDSENSGTGGIVRLSSVGTIIPKELGSNDQFFVTFDQIDSNVVVRPVINYQTPQVPTDNVTEQSLIGLKNFAEINASLSALTGISITNANAKATYENVQQQLPVSENITGFVAAQQLGVTQLAVTYCNELTIQEAAKDQGAANDDGGYYPDFIFDSNVSTAFDAIGRSRIIDPLMDQLLANNTATEDQPSFMDTEAILDKLVTDLIAKCDVTDDPDTPETESCEDSKRVESMVTAICSAAFGSGLMLIQ